MAIDIDIVLSWGYLEPCIICHDEENIPVVRAVEEHQHQHQREGEGGGHACTEQGEYPA